ncbi:MAG: PTS sugar transporter subunit IIA [Planctomycetes bacterium]|nr:PTS sugar transporter subunit IIA [Planctomycetota bacterium]
MKFGESKLSMFISSSTDDGFPVRCDVCGASSLVNVSRPPGDSVCPQCSSFLWVDAVVEITSRDQFVPDIRIHQIDSSDRDTVLREMVGAMAAECSWNIDCADAFFKAILKREEIGSTGIGSGFAIPHAPLESIDNVTSAMAFVPQGIEFNALDGRPVHTVIMLASPHQGE